MSGCIYCLKQKTHVRTPCALSEIIGDMSKNSDFITPTDLRTPKNSEYLRKYREAEAHLVGRIPTDKPRTAGF